jgi:UPF0716 protein FxsA
VLAAAGLLLIIPGFITDAVGILLFMPPVRAALWKGVKSRVSVRTTRRQSVSPARPRVLELEGSEYSSAPRPDTPWRRDEPDHP